MYSGKVSVGGPAAVRELPTVVLSKMAVGPMDNNVYLLRCRGTGEQLLIDAAAEADRILDLIGPTGVVGIVTTHRHADHWQALQEVLNATQASTYAHEADVAGIEVVTRQPVVQGSRISFGDCHVSVIHVKGHTPGSAVLLFDDPDGPPHLFTGDTLFPGGVGKTSSPQDFEQLINDVETKIFAELPDETWVYPGHGNDTILGSERPHLGEWRARGW